MDTSRLATKNQLLVVAVLTSASIFATLFNIRALSDRVAAIDHCQRELARGFVRIDSASRGLCCPPPVLRVERVEGPVCPLDEESAERIDEALFEPLRKLTQPGYRVAIEDDADDSANAEVESIDEEE